MLEAGAGLGERTDQQRHPLRPDEPPDVDEHGRVPVGSEQAIEVAVAVGDRPGLAVLAPTLGILDQPFPEARASLCRRRRLRMEAVEVDAVRDGHDPIGPDAEHVDGRLSIGRRHRDQLVGARGLGSEVRGPELTVAPLAPSGGAGQLAHGLVEPRLEVEPLTRKRGHALERRAERRGHLGPSLDRFDELELRAMEMSEHREARPAARDRVELRRQVVQVGDVGIRGMRVRERRIPHRREVLRELGRDGREHDVRCVGAVFVGRVHRHRRGERARSGLEGRDRVGVVEIVHLGGGEERGCERVVALTPERPARERDVPTLLGERHRQVARHVRRATSGEEQQPHRDASAAHPMRTLRPVVRG